MTATAFNPAKVSIERKRFSTTQGEVLLSYDGVKLEQYGDNIKMNDKGEFHGYDDAYWMEIAERDAVYKGLALDSNVTPVIFRKFPKSEGGAIIALFPANPYNHSGYTVESYMHVGQHGGADMGLVYDTKPAKPEEYADLKRELESAPYGYNLKVYAKHTNGHRDAFKAAQKAMRG